MIVNTGIHDDDELVRAWAREGWALIPESRVAHYFRDGRSLCRKALERPIYPKWCDGEGKPQPRPRMHRGWCLPCWDRAPE